MKGRHSRIDVSPHVRMGTVAMLKDWGHIVRQSSCGAEALQIIEEGTRFGFAITDQVMPRMTGMELAEEILTLRPNMPLIIATGYAELQRKLGAKFARLAKPFSQEKFAAAVREATVVRVT